MYSVIYDYFFNWGLIIVLTDNTICMWTPTGPLMYVKGPEHITQVKEHYYPLVLPLVLSCFVIKYGESIAKNALETHQRTILRPEGSNPHAICYHSLWLTKLITFISLKLNKRYA